MHLGVASTEYIHVSNFQTIGLNLGIIVFSQCKQRISKVFQYPLNNITLLISHVFNPALYPECT